MELLEKIAFYMPDWRLDRRHEYQPYFLGPDQAQIHIREEGERLRFSGIKPLWPSGGYYSWEAYGVPNESIGRTRISCAKARGAKAIAVDLQNRLIKNYLPMYRIARANLAEEWKQLDELNHVAALTKRILQGRDYGTNKPTETQRRFCFKEGDVTISCYNGGHMSFTLPYLSYEEGVKLAAFLSENILNKRAENS